MPSSDPPLIAVVDDDASVCRSLRRLLRAAGYAAEAFASAREFLEWLPDKRVGCVLLDVQMKEMNGFELQTRLTLPVLFITSHDDAVTRSRIEKSGAAGHLWKPFAERTVLESVRRVVGGTAGGPLRR